jgi:diacylglycerol kinase (ATP)
MSRRVMIIAHGRFRGHRTILSVAERTGYTPLYTDRQGHAEHLATLIHADTSMLIVVGGDGVLHEVVNGLMRRDASRRPPILLIPLGTGNDTARALGSKSRLRAIIRCLDKHHVVTWDVLQLSYTGLEGEPTTRYCINIADVGFGGHVMQHYSSRLREVPLGLGYVLASLRGFISSRPVPMHLTTGLQTREGTMLMACLCNSRWFGAGLGIAPLANPSDGLMDITLVGKVSPLTYLRYLPRLMLGKPIHDSRVEYLKTRVAIIKSPESAPLEIDGEFVGFAPVTAQVVPSAIRFVVAGSA